MMSADIAERVRTASARGERLRITGAGTWLDAGRPVADAAPLPLAALTGIVDYTAGDLTLTARAGTPLQEIARVTAAERQFLALDPFGRGEGTIGATVATASAGPLAHAFGTPRDAVLGVEAVTGDGSLIRGGGRVVKNVAGFDLTRLLTGAWGTLGVITEVSVRLRAWPEAEETIALALRNDSAPALAALLARVRAAEVAPWALELLSPALAARLGVAAHPVLLARLGGNEESVRTQRRVFATLAAVVTPAGDVWAALRAAEPPSAAVVRLSARPSALPILWRTARDATASWSGAFTHASPGRGIVRAILPGADAARTSAFLQLIERAGARYVAERLPASCWASGVHHDPVADPLSQRAREAFDPRRILNPGLLGREP